jgi:hypothetical protein
MFNSNKLFYDAVISGDLTVVQNIMNIQNDTIYMSDIKDAFKLSCRVGHLNVAKWLYEIKPNMNISMYDDYVFKTACSMGYLNMAKWLYEICPTINISAENEFAFRHTCSGGHLNVAKWLYEICPTINISAENNYAFKYTCFRGHLNIAKWLYLIKPDIDISADDEYVFKIACNNGNLNVAKWLCEICPDIDISSCNELAFRTACYYEHLDMVQWLCELNPKKYYVKISGNKIIDWYIRKTIITNQTKQIHILESIKCPICMDEDVQIQTNCEHSYCLDCITEWYNKSNSCPYCRQQINDFYQIVEKIE